MLRTTQKGSHHATSFNDDQVDLRWIVAFTGRVSRTNRHKTQRTPRPCYQTHDYSQVSSPEKPHLRLFLHLIFSSNPFSHAEQKKGQASAGKRYFPLLRFDLHLLTKLLGWEAFPDRGLIRPQQILRPLFDGKILTQIKTQCNPSFYRCQS